MIQQLLPDLNKESNKELLLASYTGMKQYEDAEMSMKQRKRKRKTEKVV
jgi:hypothetical protein